VHNCPAVSGRDAVASGLAAAGESTITGKAVRDDLVLSLRRGSENVAKTGVAS